MLAAMKEATSDTMGVKCAALEYEILRITLKDRISGCLTHGTTKPITSFDNNLPVY